MTMRFGTSAALGIGAIILVTLSAATTSAWTGPTATAPGNNTSAPINVGSTAQVKNGTIGVNGLAVFGNTLLQGGSYLNFGSTAGSGGYGIWDNGGTLQFKNSGGGWQSLQSIVAGLVTGGGTIGGSGTANYIPRFTNGTTLGNSTLSSDGVSSTANGDFHVTGNIYVPSSWGSSDSLQLNGNQLWNSGASGDGLYLNYSNYGGAVNVGGQGGYTNQLNVYGPTWVRDNLTVQGSASVGGSTVCTAANGACHGSNLNWNWAGQGGQPSWLWGSNDGTNMYVWNPSNFSVNYANSAGNANTTDGYSFNQWVTNGANVNFGNVNANGQLSVQNALQFNGNQMWTNSGTLYLNYSNSGGEVDVGNSNNRNNNFVDWGNVYSSARGAWMSEMARDDGGQFAVSGNTCPSGSLLYGFYAGGDAEVCSRTGPNGSCQQWATDVSYCQWIN